MALESVSVSPLGEEVTSIVVSVSASLPDERLASVVLSASVSPLGEDVSSVVVSASISPTEGVASVVGSISTSPLDEDVSSIVVSASISPPAEGVSLIVGSVLVSFDVLGDGFITGILLFLFPAGGLILVCFCSHPTSNAAPATISMYFLTARELGPLETNSGEDFANKPSQPTDSATK